MESIVTTFDYGQLDAETRIVVQQRTSEIRTLMRRTAQDIIEIGQKLIDVKAQLGHGRFGGWLRAEFKWSDQTALNFMNVARSFPEIPNGLEFAPRALYLLAAPSTPAEAREEALQRAANGETVTHSLSQQIVRRHKLEDPGLSDEERAYERERDKRGSDTHWRNEYTRGEAEPLELEGYLVDALDAGDLAINQAKTLDRLLANVAPMVREAAVNAKLLDAELIRLLHDKRDTQTVQDLLASGYLQPGEAADATALTVLRPHQLLRALDVAHKERRAQGIEEGKRVRRERAQHLPEKIYNVFYADPPWQYDNTGVNGAAEAHYDTLPLDQICAFLTDKKVQVDENAVLFMWVTSPFARDAFAVADAWGFTYKSQMIWHKTELTKPGTGWYVRQHHELLYICTRGRFTPLDESHVISSVFTAPLMEHSRKPDSVYTVIEKLYPQCRYLELFGRRTREGWDVIGNEVEAREIEYANAGV